MMELTRTSAHCSLPPSTRQPDLWQPCGKGALMAKTDLCSAYRQVPVHSNDQHLLGIEWKGQIYIDKALPFGLRSAPKIFSAVADGLAWALHCSGVSNTVHYLDDFLFWGPPESATCGEALATATNLCARLGLPTSPSKTIGPATCFTFLGIDYRFLLPRTETPNG